ncbi:MAG: twin-arginine translocation signal domain-containing protein [Chitinophagaceae bacterium]|nr:MAG: twin-arginine translocation signal domain-containing protein [Chitinophagaceae bacterium]
MVSRRIFLKGGALALVTAGIGGVPTFIAKAAQSRKLWSPYKRGEFNVFPPPCFLW